MAAHQRSRCVREGGEQNYSTSAHVIYLWQAAAHHLENLMLRKLALATFTFFALALSARAAEPAPVKVLLIGADRDQPAESREYMTDLEILARCLRQTKGVEAIVSNGWPKDAGVLKDVKTIVVYSPRGGNLLFEGAARKQTVEMLKNGVGLVAIHSGMIADQGETGEFLLNNLGGWFHSESKLVVRNAKIKQFDSAHPICQGWDEFVIRDEYFQNLRLPREANPVLKAKVDDEELVVAWSFERDDAKKGRSFGFVPGHYHTSFAEEGVRKCLVNAILWTARRDVPKEGFPAAQTAKELELPNK
jgi:type 1 glutamine amidotransferase